MGKKEEIEKEILHQEKKQTKSLNKIVKIVGGTLGAGSVLTTGALELYNQTHMHQGQEQGGVNMKEEIRELKEALKNKVDKATLKVLIGQLQLLIDDIDNKTTQTLVKAILQTLKDKL